MSVHQILLLSYPYRMPLLIFHLMPSIVLIVTLIHVLLLASFCVIRTIRHGRDLM